MSPAIVTKDTLTPWFEKTKAELAKLGSCEIRVGILSSADGELLRIARVHEFGATITPKTAKNLAIPLKPSLRGKSPRDIPNTWIYSNEENAFIAKDTGPDTFELLFLLLPSVTIPERSFIRAGYDNNKDALSTAIREQIKKIMVGDATAEQAANYVGVMAVSLIREYMATVQPPKSSVTLASAPGKTTPLMMTGRLRDAISYSITWR